MTQAEVDDADWCLSEKAVTLARGAPSAVASSHRGHQHPVSSSPEWGEKEIKKKKTLNDNKQIEPAPLQTTSCKLQTGDSIEKKQEPGQGFYCRGGIWQMKVKTLLASRYDFIWYCLQIILLPAVYNKYQRSQSYCFHVWCVLLLQQLQQHISASVSLLPEN